MTHYYLRESFRDGGHFLSRDLIDLGTDPAEHIIYPGGNAFYYVIFNINQSFNESFAKKRPQYLKQSDVDDHFIKEICRLNRTSRSGQVCKPEVVCMNIWCDIS
jgi:hypothetical protein